LDFEILNFILNVYIKGNPVAQEIRSGSVARVFDNDMFSSG
jgi:hypothetical protein